MASIMDLDIDVDMFSPVLPVACDVSPPPLPPPADPPPIDKQLHPPPIDECLAQYAASETGSTWFSMFVSHWYSYVHVDNVWE